MFAPGRHCGPAAPCCSTGYGNLRTCVAALPGEAAEELTSTELDRRDPAFPLLACAAARRDQPARLT